MTAKAYNDHNVYILGAGFAAEAGLPLIKDFMNRMRDAAAWLEMQGGREREQIAIGRVLEFRLRAAAASHRVPLNVENVEELFSLASASGDEELANAMPSAIAATLDYARQRAKPAEDWRRFQIGVLNQPDWKPPSSWATPLPYIQEAMKNGDRKGKWYSCPPYDFYVGVMAGYFNKGGPERRDTIITFNYDTIIEDTLRDLRVPFSYGLPADSIDFDETADRIKALYSEAGIELLKLHGSLNWWALYPEELERFRRRVQMAGVKTLADGGHLTEEQFNHLLRGGRRHGRLTVYGGYGNGPTPFLVPPTWRKIFSGFYGSVWDASVTALRTATNVIILGYSVPATDQHFRYLLAAGLQDNISLRKVLFVNPALKDEREREMIESRLFGPLGLFRQELRKQGVIEFIGYNGEDTREFFTGPHDIYAPQSYRAMIGRPLSPEQYGQEDAPVRFSDRAENTGTWR